MNDNLLVLNFLMKPLCILNDDSEDRARSIKLEKVINGVSKLTFDIPLNSSKWHYAIVDNLVLYKGQLFVIQTPDLNKSVESGIVTVQCHHLSVNLEGKLNPAFEKTDAIAKTVREMGQLVLDGTGWAIGDVDIPDAKKRSLIVKEQSAMANIKKMAELFDCDYYFDANLDNKLVHFRENAEDNLLTVAEGVNLRSMNVTIDKSQIITRIYVFGGNDSVTNRPISIYGAKMVDADGNPVMDGGVQKIYDKTYLEDYSYYLEQGYDMSYISAHPEFFLKESVLNLSDYINKDDLYADTIKIMKSSAQPKIDVSFDMADKIDNQAMFLHTPELMEIIYLYSEDINSKMTIKNDEGYSGNLFQLKVDGVKFDSEKPDSVQITAKNYSDYGGIVQNLVSNMDMINKVIQTDGTINTTKLQGWIDVLSTQLNSTQSNWYTDSSGNIILQSLDNTSAMKLGGGIFGLANSKNPDGTWQWRSFGTGNGFTATEIVAGWLIGGKVKFDLDGGKLLIGDDWNTNYFLKFEPATGLKLKFTSTYLDFSDNGIIIRGNDNQTLISQNGMADTNTDTVTDNVASGYPLRIPVKIDDSVSVVHRVLLNYTNQPFRTYSTGADSQSINLTSTNSADITLNTTGSTTINLTTTNSQSFTASSTTTADSKTETTSSAAINLTSTGDGGSKTVTSASGGATTSSSGGSSTNTVGVYGWTQGTAVSTTGITATTSLPHQHQTYTTNLAHTHRVSISAHTHTIGSHTHSITLPDHSHSITMPAHSHTVTIPAHSHNFTVPSHSHSITMPSHNHSITVPSHSHSITMPSHSHGVVFGILETAVTNNTNEVWINGVKRTTTTASQGVIDITQWITTAGWHNIEIRSTTMKKISASVSVKSYMTR